MATFEELEQQLWRERYPQEVEEKLDPLLEPLKDILTAIDKDGFRVAWCYGFVQVILGHGWPDGIDATPLRKLNRISLTSSQYHPLHQGVAFEYINDGRDIEKVLTEWIKKHAGYQTSSTDGNVYSEWRRMQGKDDGLKAEYE